MGKLWCHEGEHEVPVAFKPSPGERWCPDHPDCHLGEKPKKPSGLGSQSESPAEQRAREHFNAVVKSERCFYSDRTPEGEPRREGHRCIYPLDAHHVVETQWIKQYFSDLPEADFLAILHDPRLGAPLCRAGHENVKRLRIFWDELATKCIERAEEIDRLYGDVPMSGGAKRPSFVERLKVECPVREVTR